MGFEVRLQEAEQGEEFSESAQDSSHLHLKETKDRHFKKQRSQFQGNANFTLGNATVDQSNKDCK
jgi:hypothetical protein